MGQLAIHALTTLSSRLHTPSSYAYTPGRIEVVGDDMPALTQRPAWDAMNLAGALTVFGKILASHICSYTCFTS